jgi:hypothetical protein
MLSWYCHLPGAHLCPDAQGSHLHLLCSSTCLVRATDTASSHPADWSSLSKMGSKVKVRGLWIPSMAHGRCSRNLIPPVPFSFLRHWVFHVKTGTVAVQSDSELRTLSIPKCLYVHGCRGTHWAPLPSAASAVSSRMGQGSTS